MTPTADEVLEAYCDSVSRHENGGGAWITEEQHAQHHAEFWAFLGDQNASAGTPDAGLKGGPMANFTLDVATDNPDFKKRLVEAFDQIGLDRDDAGRCYDLSAVLIGYAPDNTWCDGGEKTVLLWGTEYDGNENNQEGV